MHVIRPSAQAGQSPEPPSHVTPPSVPPPVTPRALLQCTRYRFDAGAPAGSVATIRSMEGETLFSYRGFASPVGVVAALMTGIVAVTGIAASAFLFWQHRPITAIASLLLASAFVSGITLLLPDLSITIFTGEMPVVTITRQSRTSLPGATYSINSGDGVLLARVRKSLSSRIGRNRWLILANDSDRVIGDAAETSLIAAIARKLGGTFTRSLQTDLRLRYLGRDVGTIHRRPLPNGTSDLLDVSEDPTTILDRRIALALATLILGSEP
jgi:hypothetical protein